ncbi:MAG: hypothetical protein CVU42_00835 [Chloroflexi bacterium HGW-Chloroflexi-4]|nr:MAG: hypothetical protein CVU42_00835 [Chloroflexi bacterium HGW-Chloroflexi-4]
MEKKLRLTLTLSTAGTIFVLFPVLAPIGFSIINLFSNGKFLLDFLMPAELGLLVMIGGGLLIWAALRSKSHLKWIAWSFGFAILLVVVSQALAGITGLASGSIDPSGWPYIIVLGGIIGYDIAVILLGIGGVLLCQTLLRTKK